MAFLDLVNELTGTVPGLSPLLAEKYINRAWKDIRSERLWSFLATTAAVVCPAQVTAGAVAIVQYSDSVTLDATASAALLAQTNVNAVPGITNLSIRFGATSPAIGQVYNIEAADITTPTAIILTLDRFVVEATNATSGYQCYRPYITPPSSDFLKWETVVDMVNAFTLWGPRTTRTSAEFDMRDPQRQAQGLAYWLGSYVGAFIPDPTTGVVNPNPNVEAGSNIYELWPHPTSGQTFLARYRRRGVDFLTPTETQPDVISDAMIIQRALGWHVYAFAAANVANFPSFKNVNWLSLIKLAKDQYARDLLDAKRNDNEAALQDVWNMGHGLRNDGSFDFKGMAGFPIDSNYMQSHLIRF